MPPSRRWVIATVTALITILVVFEVQRRKRSWALERCRTLPRRPETEVLGIPRNEQMAYGAVGLESAARLIQQLRAALKKLEELPPRQPIGKPKPRSSVSKRSSTRGKRKGRPSWKPSRKMTR